MVTVVDFGPSQDLLRAFSLQQLFNPPGMSPPMCSEFYTGWLTHWGEVMANTSAETAAEALQKLLAFGGHTASVNLYMAHGGTNFGFWAGGWTRPGFGDVCRRASCIHFAYSRLHRHQAAPVRW